MYQYPVLLLLSSFFQVWLHGVAPPQTTPKEALYEIFEAEKGYQQKQDSLLFPAVLPTAQKERAAFYQQLLNRLDKIPYDSLSNTDQINYDVFQYILEDRIAEVTYEAYLIPFNAEGGFYNSIGWMLRSYTFDNKTDYQQYTEQLRALPQYLRDNIYLMKLGIQKGAIAPQLIAKNYKALIAPFLDTTIEASILYQPFSKRLSQWKDGSKEVSLTALKLDNTTIRNFIRDSILNAYQQLDQFMQHTYLPAARKNVGISAIPRGRDYYRQRIRFFTSLPMSPEEVFAKGEEEVARIRKAMEAILAELQFEGSFSGFLDMLRTDERFYAKSPRDLLKEASYISKKIDGQLPNYFGRLPRLPYGVAPVPEAIAPTYTSGRYSPGSAKAYRAGQYWVNTYQLESRPLYVLPALTLHEAVPGHHLQISLAEEMGELPTFRNTYLSAFGEGWALYCEWLGKEMGIYENAYEDFGRLTYEMWRACRLVVDVGLHYKGWSRERAFQFLSSHTALSLHECNTEIDRYIGWPGQAVSYKIGELKIRELRRWAEAEQGEQFDIRAFHDAILANGSVPLFVLERIVKQAFRKTH